MSRSIPSRVLMAASAVVALAGSTLAPQPARADFTEPAAQQIDNFDAALIRAMKAGKDAGPQGRAKIMGPAVDAAFNLSAMTGFAVGPAWAGASAQDKAALVSAFRKYTIANYAKNFDSYEGQKIAVDPMVMTRLPDKLVKTTMSGNGSTVVLGYRMRQAGGTWKIIDVLFNGAISQLTTQRSDFASTLQAGGVKALVAKLNSQTDKLLKP